MKNFVICLILFGEMILFAEPTVTDVVAKQRYPWNGLVDITCKVSGITITGTGAEYRFVAEAVFPDSGRTQKVENFWVVRNGGKSNDWVISDNGDYRLLWDAKADLGEVRYTNMVVRVIVDRPRVQLWEDGPYWATTNIGAEKPEDYGYYFWWGDIVGYKWENDKWVASDGSNSNFSFSSGNTPTYGKGNSTLQSEGWITADGVLSPEHDAAQKHWGGDWRMPTKQEFDNLISKCDWTWGSMNGVNGYVIRGKGDYSSASIFLPCAGSGASLNDAGSYGYYWSSVPDTDGHDAWRLYFNSSRHSTDSNYRYGRLFGQSVRPLQGFTK